jgi:hypothetical protein
MCSDSKHYTNACRDLVFAQLRAKSTSQIGNSVRQAVVSLVLFQIT